ncbi:MAG: AsmA-like C-terminal region-containing protein [Myxococcota bacterium]|nr:AsmA-like C-terminal region-containing protein [Myxococcota bacterium]
MRRSALRAAVILGLFLLALATGFVLSSQVGQRWLREEAEFQLGEILDGEVSIDRVALRVRTSLELQLVGIRVDYPSPALGGMSAKQVIASLETTSLLLGRFGVDSLEIDGLGIQLQRNRWGEWSPPWFPSRTELEERRETSPSDLEHELGWMKVLIESAHFVLHEQMIADRIELTGGFVTLEDAQPRRDAPTETRHRFENIRAELDHGWLSDSSDFSLSARWVAPDAPRATLEINGRHREDEDLHLTLAFSELELASLNPYIVTPDLGGAVSGRMTGVVAVTSPDIERGTIELDWSVEEIKAQIPFGDTSLAFASPVTSLQARLILEPERLQIDSIQTRGQSIDFDLSGNIARPLGLGSQTSLRSNLRGTGVDDLERIADGLPDSDAAPFRSLLDRLRSGRVPRVGMRGNAALRTWLAIAGGELAALPPTIRLSANIEDVTIGTSKTDTLSEMSGELEWNGARFELRDFRAEFNGDPIPRIDFTLDGLSTVFENPPDEDRITRRARSLPGLGTLWEIFRTDERPTRGEPPSPIQVRLHELQHPVLRWPVRDAVFEIDPTASDVNVAITHGHWAGVPIRGEAQLHSGNEPHLSIALRIAEAAESDVHPDDSENHVGDDSKETWASGHFSTKSVHSGSFELETLEGQFALRGQDLVLRAIDGQLDGGGSVSGEGVFSLSQVEAVPAQATLRVRDAEADRVAQTFGIAAGYASGRANLRAEFSGDLRTETRIVNELAGHIELKARDGEVQQSVPLIAAIAHAIEGWSPAAARTSLKYERIDARINFDAGQISTDRFALDGPLRIVASFRVDLDDEPDSIKGTLGVFLLRQAHRLLGNIPLVNLLVPGSDRGLIGAYFEISGPLHKPKISTMPIRSLTGGVPLPDVLRQPFEALIGLFPTSSGSGTKSPKPKRKPNPEPVAESSLRPILEPRSNVVDEAESAPEDEATDSELDPQGDTP